MPKMNTQLSPSGQVLGIPYEYSVAGSPLVPPTYVTIYFLGFVALVCAVYAYFYFRHRPVLLWHKVRLLVFIAVVLKISLIGGGSWLAAYWLVPPPHVRLTDPVNTQAGYSPTNKVEIYFDRPVSRSTLEKSISPETPGRWVFESAFYATHFYRKLVFYPTYSLRPDTTYTVRLQNIRNLVGVFEPYDHAFAFATQPSPRVKSVSPENGKQEVSQQSDIVIKLDVPNHNISEFDFQISPPILYNQLIDDTRTVYTLQPKEPLLPGVTYRIHVQKTNVMFNLDEAILEERSPAIDEYEGVFTTRRSADVSLFDIAIASVKTASVSGVSPRDGWTAVNIHSPVKVTFDREVDKASAQEKFSIIPATEGAFSWNGTMMVFTPNDALPSTTVVTTKIAEGVKATDGSVTRQAYTSTFTTQNATTKLSVPSYLQKYTLSCEIASLRMALNYRDLTLTEDELIPIVGQDPTPHTGNVWGDPNIAFVGNIAGTQMANGYGVHWAPIAKAAREYRNAADFTQWTIEQLTGAIEGNNPVIIWVYSHHGTPTSWKTPDGRDVYAVRDEHAVVAVGFVGPANNPTQLIINDPLIGQVYWSRAVFDRKWNIFNRSGVVVY